MKQDAYVDPTSCFVYVASVTRQLSAENYYLGNPTSPSSTQFSNNTVSSGGARKFLLYRVNNDLTLNAASSMCPSSSPTPRPVSPLVMAGNDTELLTRYYSGVNGYGEWTVATNDNRSLDVQHPEDNLTMVAYGANHQCRIIGSDLSCKGDNTVGQLGDGTTTTSSSFVTVDATSMGGVKAVSIGSDFTCALDNDGDAWCWGKGEKFRLGDKDKNDSNVPRKTTMPNDGTKLVSLTSGQKHTCGLGTDNNTYCWGSNEEGQMSADNSTNSVRQVSRIADLSGPTKVVSTGVNATFTCAITQLSNATNDNITECWGTDNSGRYNDPYTVPGITTAVDVAVGQNHACAALADGSVRCWGDNSYNQAPSSINVYTLRSKALSIYAWDDYTCASLENGGYTCWGDGNIWVN
jgi:alpha-tubulin suppressor-like RCC1 family protein